MLCRKAGITEHKWNSHSYENFFGDISDKQSVKDLLGETLVNRADYVKHYKKSEHKWKGGLKALKREKNIIFSMANKFGSCHEIKNIKKKAYRKSTYSSSDISISDSDYDYSFYSDSK